MAWYNRKKEPTVEERVNNAIKELQLNADTATLRQRAASVLSGSNYTGDTLHQIQLDYGYPDEVTFEMSLGMNDRFGIANCVVELPVDTTWMTMPIIEASDNFTKELDKIIKGQKLWQRLKGLDKRQRVGRYAGMFMRVRDGKQPHEPIEGGLNGVNSLVQMIPYYEGQIKPSKINDDPMSDDYGLPEMYQFNGSGIGNRDETEVKAFSIHPDRLIIAAEGADNGDIYGVSVLTSCYNSLMDLRKIIGAGGEGFYKNAAQSIVFTLNDISGAAGIKDMLKSFNDEADDFMRNRSSRSLFAPGLTPKTLESNLADPKSPFDCALNDVSASAKIPATIIIGQQTGRLASSEDSRSFLSTINSRRSNYTGELIENVLNWFIKYGILPADEFEVEWDDLLALSDTEKLGNSEKMSTINQNQFNSGGDRPFSSEEIRVSAGYDEQSEDDIDEEGEDDPKGDEVIDPVDDKE